MNLLFNAPSWILIAFLIVAPAMILSLAALWLVRKYVSTETLRKNHDVAGFTFSIVGVLYSVVLGFIVISAQNRYNEALETLHTEATMLADLYRDAAYFETNSRSQIRSALRSYVHYVVEEEWHLPKRANRHFEAQQILGNLWNSYLSIPLLDEKTKIWYTQSIEKLDNLMNARLAREFNSWQRLGSMMWTLLILGAVITVGFMFFFGLENLHIQMLMTALLSGYLTFMLYLVFSLDNVFQGPTGIQPHALEEVLSLFNRWD